MKYSKVIMEQRSRKLQMGGPKSYNVQKFERARNDKASNKMRGRKIVATALSSKDQYDRRVSL